jgi:hypothetical protein
LLYFRGFWAIQKVFHAVPPSIDVDIHCIYLVLLGLGPRLLVVTLYSLHVAPVRPDPRHVPLVCADPPHVSYDPTVRADPRHVPPVHIS